MIGPRLLAIAVLLAGGGSWAQGRSMEGFGRIALLPGWRLTPNDHFYASASAKGYEREALSPGGPMLTGAFAYAATDNIEVCIDLFGAYEELRLKDAQPVTSISYGALAGARFQWPGLFSDHLIPYLGIFTGPTLVFVSSDTFGGATETLTNGWAGSAGLSWRLADRLGATLEYRLLLARGLVPEIGGINAGGSFFSLGISTWFPPEAPSGGPLR